MIDVSKLSAAERDELMAQLLYMKQGGKSLRAVDALSDVERRFVDCLLEVCPPWQRVPLSALLKDGKKGVAGCSSLAWSYLASGCSKPLPRAAQLALMGLLLKGVLADFNRGKKGELPATLNQLLASPPWFGALLHRATEKRFPGYAKAKLFNRMVALAKEG